MLVASSENGENVNTEKAQERWRTQRRITARMLIRGGFGGGEAGFGCGA